MKQAPREITDLAEEIRVLIKGNLLKPSNPIVHERLNEIRKELGVMGFTARWSATLNIKTMELDVVVDIYKINATDKTLN